MQRLQRMIALAACAAAACASPYTETEEEAMLAANMPTEQPGTLLAKVTLSDTHSLEFRELMPGELIIHELKHMDLDEHSALSGFDMNSGGLHELYAYATSFGDSFDASTFEVLREADARARTLRELNARAAETAGHDALLEDAPSSDATDESLVDKNHPTFGQVNCEADRVWFERFVEAARQPGFLFRTPSHNCAAGNRTTSYLNVSGYQVLAFNQSHHNEVNDDFFYHIDREDCGWFSCSFDFVAWAFVPPRHSSNTLLPSTGGDLRTVLEGHSQGSTDGRWSHRSLID